MLADAEHEAIAVEMVGQQCALEPRTADDVVFGVPSTLVVEQWFAETLLNRWSMSSLQSA